MRVVYLLVADNVLRPLPIRLRRVHQPVISAQKCIFNLAFNPLGMIAGTPAPLHATIIHRPRCLHTLRLRPRWYTEQEHLAECPHMVGEARRHRGRAGPPLFGRARAMGRDRLGQGLA